MPNVINFSDVTTQGNTVLQQNLTVRGAFSTFSGNLFPSVTNFSTLGNSTARFLSIYSQNLNVTYANTTAIVSPAGVIGIGTTPVAGGAALQIQGNVFVSNSIVSTNLYTTNVNTSTTNTLAIFGPTGVIGIGTNPLTGGASLQVQGNLFAANALTAPTVFGANVNASTLNTVSIFGQTGVVGINTTPALSGATLQIQGNMYASNAISTQNVFAANVITTTTNTLVIYGPAGLVGIGTLVPGASLHVAGNLWASNAISAPNVVSTTLNSTTLNVASILPAINAAQNVYGIGFGFTQNIFANVQILGNLYASNALSAPGLTATTLNVAVMNVLVLYPSINATQNVFGVGVGLSQNISATFQVAGNLWASNAISAPNVLTTTLNTTTANILTILGRSGVVGVGTAPVTGGALLQVQGNLFAANAIQTTNVIATQANLTYANVQGVYGPQGVVGVNQVPVASGATLQVSGNVYATNAISATNLFVTNVFTTGIYGPNGLIGIGQVPVPGSANLQIVGNVYASNALTALNATATTANINTLNVQSFLGTQSVIGVNQVPVVGGAGIQISGNLYAANAVSALLVTATNMNVNTLNAFSIFGQGGVTGVNQVPVASGATLQIGGNLWASNAISAQNVVALTLNTTTLNVASIYPAINVTQNILGVGIGFTQNVMAALQVSGNVYASNAISTTNVFVTTLNATTMNLFSLFPGSNALSNNYGIGIGLTQNITAALQVSGNIYASNAISAPSIYTSNLNAATVNTTSIYSPLGLLGIGTNINLGATLQVLGNIYVSTGMIATNVIAQSVNSSIINTFSIVGAAGGVGVGTTLPAASLHVVGNVYASNGLQASILVATSVNTTSLTISQLYGPAGAGVGIGTVPQVGGAALQVVGNIYASNSIIAPSILLQTLNTVSINTNSLVGTYGAIGIGTTPIQGGSNLQVLGNIYASNAFLTSVIYATTLNTNFLNVSTIFTATGVVGVNQVPVTGSANLQILGNLYASNAIQVTNVVATNLNVTYINTASFFTNSGVLGIGTTPVIGGANLQVGGNLFVSNALFTNNIFANTVNVNIVNVSSFYSSSGTFGVGVLAPPTGPNLYVVGNTFVSNAIQTTNLVVSGTINYGEDLFKRGPWLIPSAGNAAAITGWINSTINAASVPQSWWSSSAMPAYGNVANGPRGSTDYGGTVVLPDGRVLFAPYSASNVGVFNPATNQFSTIIPSSGSLNGGPNFTGGVLAPNGNVIFISQGSFVGVFNPETYAYTQVTIGTTGFRGGVLLPNGKVVLVPNSATDIGLFDTQTLTYSTNGTSTGGFWGGVLLPTGNVVFVPYTSTTVGQYDPSSGTIQSVAHSQGTNAFSGGVLVQNGRVVLVPHNASAVTIYNPDNGGSVSTPAVTGAPAAAFSGGFLTPSGNVIFVPYSSSSFGVYDPSRSTYSTGGVIGSGTSKFIGGSLMLDGRGVFGSYSYANIVVLNTIGSTPPELCLSPYLNKF